MFLFNVIELIFSDNCFDKLLIDLHVHIHVHLIILILSSKRSLDDVDNDEQHYHAIYYFEHTFFLIKTLHITHTVHITITYYIEPDLYCSYFFAYSSIIY